MSSVSKPRVRQNRHKQGLNQTLEKISADFRLYNNAEGVELSPTVFQSFSGCFAEGLGDGLSVECEYDIYDRVSGENNKIETRTVVNGLKSLLQNMKRGRKKVINLLVDPTYLYQLSDGDVDK